MKVWIALIVAMGVMAGVQLDAQAGGCCAGGGKTDTEESKDTSSGCGS